MNDSRRKISEEIEALVTEGAEILKGEASQLKTGKAKVDKGQKSFSTDYQLWYSRALPIVKQLLPDRYEEFQLCYKNDKRRN